LAIAVATALGATYVGRLSNHRGYFLVPVEDSLPVFFPWPRPRHTVVILIDGLSQAAAERLEATKTLRREGQCRVMNVGPITISRPTYAVLSTGLEEDRTGSRNNDEASPLAADSVWQVARRAELEVNGVSMVRWWLELFPDGFSSYVVLGAGEDYFARSELADLNLIHPGFVDAAGHAHGSASAEYTAAVQRVDRELTAFLGRVDFSQDLVVLTSDHGHTSYGGHGGPQPEVARVLTCFAGRKVALRADERSMDARSFGPAVALLMGLPFPKTMRAGEDELDVLFEIADKSAFATDYLPNRRAAIGRFREANETALAQWVGDGEPPTWSRLYAHGRRVQAIRLALSAAVFLSIFTFVARRRGLGAGGALAFSLWACVTVALTLAAYVAVRSSLDFTSINSRREFLLSAGIVCTVVAVIAAGLHRWLLRDPRRLVEDEATLAGLAAFAVVAHVFVYGWPLGFPLPGPGALFFPFFAPVFAVAHGAFGAATCVIFWRARP
jgi:hypothetical protein